MHLLSRSTAGRTGPWASLRGRVGTGPCRPATVTVTTRAAPLPTAQMLLAALYLPRVRTPTTRGQTGPRASLMRRVGPGGLPRVLGRTPSRYSPSGRGLGPLGLPTSVLLALARRATALSTVFCLTVPHPYQTYLLRLSSHPAHCVLSCLPLLTYRPGLCHFFCEVYTSSSSYHGTACTIPVIIRCICRILLVCLIHGCCYLCSGDPCPNYSCCCYHFRACRVPMG